MKLNEVERGIKEAQLAQKELEQGQAQLTTMVASLASQDFAGAEQTKLLQLDKEIEALGYDDVARTDAYALTQELQPFLEKFRQLSDAEAQLAPGGRVGGPDSGDAAKPAKGANAAGRTAQNR